MGTSMHVVWSSAEEGRVVYETYSITLAEDGVHGAVDSRHHEIPVVSRKQAEEIAAEHGYELLRKGEVWESLPEN